MLPQLVRMIVQPETLLRLPLIEAENLFRQPIAVGARLYGGGERHRCRGAYRKYKSWPILV
jgi:hypothetical protein